MYKWLGWDSTFWNFDIAQVEQYDLKYLKRQDKLYRDNNIKFSQAILPFTEYQSRNNLNECGYKLIDIPITFTNDFDRVEYNNNFDCIIKKAEYQHINELKKISGSRIKDTRYQLDEKFDKRKAKLLYEKWVENAVLGTFDHECMIIQRNEDIVGFCTLRYLNDKEVRIGLIATTKSGIGEYFLNCVLTYLKEYKNMKRVLVTTQLHNIPAQRLYQKCGFRTFEIGSVYHKWMD